MIWKLSFKIPGIVCVLGGLYAFYDYGAKLLPLFTEWIRGVYDITEIFTVLSSFLFGALALIWVGIRLVTLRSFLETWVCFAILPIVAWLVDLYNVGLIGTLSMTLSFSVVYIGTYIVIVCVARFVHKHWFIPVSHDDGRRVGLEKPSTSFLVEYKWAVLLVVLLVFVIFNPSDAVKIFDTIISAVVYAFNWLQQ